MSKFKMIDNLRLNIETCTNAFGGRDFVVNAYKLESILQSAQLVKRYGNKNGKGPWWDYDTNNPATHSALLIGIAPIKKKTKAEAALELLERLESMNGIFNVAWVKDDMKRILEMKDEV